jgi:hypothetical protein
MDVSTMWMWIMLPTFQRYMAASASGMAGGRVYMCMWLDRIIGDKS